MTTPEWYDTSRKIEQVMVWPNGMVMVFGPNGEQLPEYQGRWSDKEAEIRAHFDGVIQFMSEWIPPRAPVTRRYACYRRGGGGRGERAVMTDQEAQQMANLLEKYAPAATAATWGYNEIGQPVVYVHWSTGDVPRVSVRECVRYAHWLANRTHEEAGR